ncbi:MAG: transposase [Deltaproteobacteria bacterium]|nr:transposase [Deltaproteobacteria bacterium]
MRSGLVRFVLKSHGVTTLRRPLGEGLCYHVRVQCNNRAFRFRDDVDFQRYLDTVAEAKIRTGCLLHHYALMHTHVHLILTTPGPVLLDQVMKRINQKYARDYHRRHGRIGHFWMNGYRCSVIDTDTYALACMRYLDRNGLRAGLVQHPREWPWSAYEYYAYGGVSGVIDPHPSYLGLAEEGSVRQYTYRNFVETLLPSDEMRERKSIIHAMRRYGPEPTNKQSVEK